MGLFDLFRKKTPEAAKPVVDPNQVLLEALLQKLFIMDHQASWSDDHLSLVTDTGLEITAAVIESPGMHPMIIHVFILTRHEQYFPDGVAENIAGMGELFEDKVASVLDNYLASTFPPIVESLSDSHFQELDYTDDKGVLWHPKPGDMIVQGQWLDPESVTPLFDLIKEKLKQVTFNNKINWLKMYISRQADNTFAGECLLNNEPWDEGFSMLLNDSEWEQPGRFAGQKQFVVIRRCDAYD